MTTQQPQPGSTKLAELLADMNQQGGFPIAVLTDQHGFPIASATNTNQNPQGQAAVVALLQKAVVQVGKQLGMAPTDEFSLYDTNGQHLICRPLSINGYEMILAVMVPNRHQSHRHLTNITLAAIRQQWEL